MHPSTPPARPNRAQWWNKECYNMHRSRLKKSEHMIDAKEPETINIK